jgi:Transposase DDE domain group 1
VKRRRLYPRVRVDAHGSSAVSQAGGVLLVETIRAGELDEGLSRALAPWRKVGAVHDPAKVLLDLAVAVALGGDCLADAAVVRAEPAVFGLVASDATISRAIAALARDARTTDAVLAAVDEARAAARARVWRQAGRRAPDRDVTMARPLVVDVDGVLVTAHSDKEQAAPTFKRGYGHHPLVAFVDHGQDGTGEPVGMLLRRGNAGSNTAADHVTILRQALRQLPGVNASARSVGRQVLVRIDGAGCSHAVLEYLHARRLGYSVGFTLPEATPELLERIPASAWTDAYDASGQVREGAMVAELTGLLDLTGWPCGMRVIVRKERPHPGAQLRITDVNGWRVTAFATNTPAGGPGSQLPELELRHRRRARAEDRIRCMKDAGLRNLPLQGFDQNRIWLAVVALAADLTAWMQTLAFDGPARRWEPKRLRLRVFALAGALAATARTVTVHLSARSPWTDLAVQALTRLRAITAATATG